MNWNNVHFCLPIQIKSKKKSANDIDRAMIAADIVFAYWMKEIDIKRYRDNLQSLPTCNSTNIYQYSGAMLKYMPKDALKTFQNTLLYSKEDIMLTGGRKRHLHNSNNLTLRKDNNITKTLASYKNSSKNKMVYRILLRILCNIGLLNFPVKLVTKIICILETNMNKLFEFAQKVTGLPNVSNGEVLWHDNCFIQYKQIRINDKFRMSLKWSLASKNVS